MLSLSRVPLEVRFVAELGFFLTEDTGRVAGLPAPVAVFPWCPLSIPAITTLFMVVNQSIPGHHWPSQNDMVIAYI